jgi:ribulose kinase
MAEGGQSATGALLHHVMTTHAAHAAAKEAAVAKDMTVFEYLNNHLDDLCHKSTSPTLAHLTRYFSCTAVVIMLM